MSTPTHQLFIDGKLVDTADHYDLHYPYTDAIVATVARAGAGEMEAAGGDRMRGARLRADAARDLGRDRAR